MADQRGSNHNDADDGDVDDGGKPDTLRPPRGEFLRTVLLGSGALGAGLAASAGLSGCALFRAIGRSFTEGAGEGADDWANNHPEEKKKIEKIIDDIAAVTSNTKKTSEEALKIGAALVELIAYFLYLMFQKLIQDLIDELKKKFWYWRVLAAVF